MYKKDLAHREIVTRDNLSEEASYTNLTVYEVFIELGHDKEGNVLKNRDGSDRYFAIDDSLVRHLEEDVVTKRIRDNAFKPLFQVNGDYVEKVERDDGRRIYYAIEESRIVVLKKGTAVVERNDYLKTPTEVGYVLIDDTDLNAQRLLAVRKFKTEDHKAEAEEVLKTSQYIHR